MDENQHIIESFKITLGIDRPICILGDYPHNSPSFMIVLGLASLTFQPIAGMLQYRRSLSPTEGSLREHRSPALKILAFLYSCTVSDTINLTF